MLAIDDIYAASKAGDIFMNDKETLQRQYKRYAQMYHPDLCKLPDADNIMAKINSIYEQALLLIENDAWEESFALYLKQVDGKKYRLTHNKTYQFEFGDFYVGDSTVVYIYKHEYEKYWKAALDAVSRIRYPDDEVRSYFSKVMPVVRQSGELVDGNFYIAYAKDAEMYPLREILRVFDDKIPPKHSAWIMTRLNNLVCYFAVIDLVHNGITLDNIFINPTNHSVMIMGGWQYTTPINSQMISVPSDVYKVMPMTVKNSKVSKTATDVESVKAVGKHLFEHAKAEVCEIYKWCTSKRTERHFCSLDKWNDALTTTWGQRRFIELKIDKNKIYEN